MSNVERDNQNTLLFRKLFHIRMMIFIVVVGAYLPHTEGLWI